MKALVPLNNWQHVKDYIEAGAEEFYIGFYDEAWEKRFGEYADINRMSGYKKTANQYSFEEVICLIPQIQNMGVTVYITFNSGIYTKEQLEFLRHYMEVLNTCHVDGVIVSCMELAKTAVEVGVPTVISTIAGVYNSDIARYYKELGARRIILPRDLGMEEIASITNTVDKVEFEVFMMRNGCRFSDANCLGFHRKEHSSFCSVVCNSNIHMTMKDNSFHPRHAAELNNMLYNGTFHSYACGLCSIYQFLQLGISAGKIVGRTDEWENICQDIRLVKQNVEIAKRCSSEEEYLEKMIFPENSTTMCKLGLSCYYPEIRYGG